ncbi:PREDICTED: uncharacterized protein C19orf45 homolog, partial [Buceros rhinoceros silvestris]|uniref:uncharacterized protein C19orf45 homolog n=1 Tax=Buceros rhinoceros silvestris TaxID=175836 RepID=UPI0005293D95
AVTGDGQARYDTSYQAQFQGEWSPAAEPSEKGRPLPLNVAFGGSELVSCRAYDKERAASQTHRTNLRLGDGCSRFCPSTSELFPAHSPEPVTIARPNKYASSIPRGDEDPERNQASARTTTQLSYPEPRGWNLTPKPDLLLRKHQSSICLGDKSSGSHFFSTTQQADYGPPRQSPRVMADSKSHRKSHIPFSYQNEHFVTTMQAMLVPHRQQKQRLPEDMLQQIKCSHLGLPWRVQNQFRTEQKDEFTPKSRGPAEIQKANSQVSCVPLGSLKSYCPQRTRAYSGVELLHGRVWLELCGALRLQALEVCARGLATVHWVESICLGINAVYCDYADYQTFLHHHYQLIP